MTQQTLATDLNGEVADRTTVRARNDDEVIGTAEGACFARAGAAREPDRSVANPDYLAKHFLGWRYRTLLKIVPVGVARRLFERKLPGGYGSQLARTRHFDGVLHDAVSAGAKQLVVLGAGYDSRAYRFRERLQGVRVFEVDLAGTQARKKACLTRLFGQLPEHVTYVPIDFARQVLRDVLIPAGYDPSLRTHFSWEGVTYYIDEAAIANVLAFIRHDAGPGSTVVFDYWLRSYVEGDRNVYGGEKLVRYAVEEQGEPFLFGLNQDEVSGFAERHGFEVQSDLGPPEMIATYLTRRDGSTVAPPWGCIRMCHARTRT